MRRSQMLLASSRGEPAPKIALNLGCASQTVRHAIHDFDERGLEALAAKSSRPKRTRDAFDEESAEALREMLHRSAREFGRESSLWTLRMAADVAFEESIVGERVSGRPSGPPCRAFWESGGCGPKGGSPARPLVREKKGGATG